MDFTTAALAIGVLKPMRQRWLAAALITSAVATDRRVVQTTVGTHP